MHRIANYQNTKLLNYKMLLKLTVVAGDGIGPEVTEEAILALRAVADGFDHQLQMQHKPIGGAALTAANHPIPADNLQGCQATAALQVGLLGRPAHHQK